jgi:copper chaperone CopZ
MKNIGIYLFWLSILLGLFHTPAQGEIQSITLSIGGLSCPYCISGIEQLTNSIPGVASSTIWLKEGEAHLTWVPSHYFSPQAFQKAFEDSLFSLEKISIRVRGKLSLQNKRLIIHSLPDKTDFELSAIDSSSQWHEIIGKEVTIEGVIRKIESKADPEPSQKEVILLDEVSKVS